jgi:hypothetical protein
MRISHLWEVYFPHCQDEKLYIYIYICVFLNGCFTALGKNLKKSSLIKKEFFMVIMKYKIRELKGYILQLEKNKIIDNKQQKTQIL